MKSLLTLNELVSAVSGHLLSDSKECVFTNVATDSRNVEKETLFVPLVGEFQNGHKYIPQAIEKGASVVLINNEEYETNKNLWKDNINKYSDVVFISVKNTMTGLQDAAEAYVAKFPNLLKISITGSCGKTTTKEMMVSVFKAKYGDSVVYTKGNFNSETGLPLSVFQIREEHKIGIFEMGMNRVNEIGEISKVLKSHYGIITNIGTAHIGILGSRENIATEKRKSFNYVKESGAVFVPAEDDFADYCTENVSGKVIKFGKSVPASDSGVTFMEDMGLYGTKFLVDGIEVTLPLSGEYNYQNALGVIACAKELGLSAEEIKSGLENMSAISGRMEVKKVKLCSGKGITLIKDCYNANPDSMKKVIDFCESLKNIGKKIFILGDMKELGASAVEAHKEIGKKISESNDLVVYFVGTDMKNAFENAGAAESYWYEKNDSESFAEIGKSVLSIAEENDVIMIKGSHSMALENIIPLLVCEKEEK